MLAVALALLLADPQTLVGKVVSVHDGDTITIVDGEKRQHKIRLASIDAPELGQPFGRRAKEALGELVVGPLDSRWFGPIYSGFRVGPIV